MTIFLYAINPNSLLAVRQKSALCILGGGEPEFLLRGG